MRTFYVYIMASIAKVIYTGVTSRLAERVEQHKSGDCRGFTARYRCHKLVYYEEFQQVREAIAREKQIKGWLRSRKISLIESVNPKWRHLSRDS